MSAYVLSKQHIDAIVRVALEGASDGEPGHSGDELRWQIDTTLGWTNTNLRQLVRMAGVDAGGYQPISPEELGQMLVHACVRGVSERYPDDDVAAGELPGPCDPYYLTPYTYPLATKPIGRSTAITLAPPATAHVRHLSSIEAFKAIACYGYQSCEADDWETSEAYNFCEQLKERLIRRLPGYDACAGWDL